MSPTVQALVTEEVWWATMKILAAAVNQLIAKLEEVRAVLEEQQEVR